MAKYHLDRLKDKYGWKTAVAQDKVRGRKYQELITEILATNSGNVHRAVGRISKENYAKYAKNLRPEKQKRFVLPDVSEALPKRSVYFLKAAERGQLITDTLRDRLTKDLRETISAGALRTTGKDAGTVLPRAIAQFEKKIQGTFENYTKRDPKYGVPTNIHQIAITEMRINIDAMKDEYTGALLKKNPDLIVKKKWRQNTKGVKEPRQNHTELARRAGIPYHENFVYQLENGTTVSTPHPHHWSMPASEVIGCSCEVEYSILDKG